MVMSDDDDVYAFLDNLPGWRQSRRIHGLRL
jgi:hypothetical protein